MLWTPPRLPLWTPQRRRAPARRCAVTPGTPGGNLFAYVAVDTPRTLAFTAGTGSDRLLVAVLAGYYDSAAPSNAAYNGVAMSQAVLSARSSGNDFVQIWYLVANATGANNFTFTQPDNSILIAGLLDFSGVDQASPLADTDSTTGTGTSATLTLSSAVGEYVIGGASRGSDTPPTVGADQVNIYGNGTGGESGRASYEPGAASTTHSYSWTGSTSYAIAAIAVKAAGAAAAATGYMTTMRGVW
jgi:hypothetical protein